MKINSSVFFIPPYISTSWSSVSSLLIKEGVLTVHLLEGDSIEIPSLPQEVLELIFNMHMEYLEMFASLEKEDAFKFPPLPSLSLLSKPFPFFSPKEIDPIKIFMQGMGPVQTIFEHDPLQASAPLLPEELMKKIAGVARLLSNEEVASIETPVENCHCPHCQVTRALNRALKIDSVNHLVEEPITEEDLHFSDWSFSQKEKNTYIVQSNLDRNEKYEVVLGEVITCTCGKAGCEHIITVLKN